MVAVVVAGAVLAACGRPATHGGPPNVIFLTADSLRADHTSLLGYGRPTTPQLERLARDGVVYANAHSQASWTRPSYASIFTSHWTSDLARFNRSEGRIRAGADDRPYENVFGIPGGVPTVVTLLTDSEYGFAAVGYAHNPNLAPDWNFDRGFELYRSSAGRGARKVLAKTLRALEDLSGRDRPFFLFVHFQQTHYPYRSSAAFRDLWREEDELRLGDKFIGRLIASKGKILERQPYATGLASPEQGERLRRSLVNRYDRSIAELDAAIGALLDALAEKDLYEEALIVFNSDHGEELGERGEWGHGHQLHQELVHVPLVIKYPMRARVEPTVVSRPVSNLDILPTILRAVGIDLPETPFAGRDLHPSPALVRDHPFPISERGPHTGTGRRGELAIRGPRHKLILRIEDPERRIYTERAYDLVADPGELVPLSPGAPEVEILREQLLAWIDTHRGTKEEEPSPAASGRVEVRKQTLRRLRALGYLGDRGRNGEEP